MWFGGLAHPTAATLLQQKSELVTAAVSLFEVRILLVSGLIDIFCLCSVVFLTYFYICVLIFILYIFICIFILNIVFYSALSFFGC